MDTYIIPLGIGSALPREGRHFSSTALLREDTLLLFDCGEGTQLRLLAAGLKRTRIQSIFVTHLHGDHIFGLPGLITTLTLLGYNKPLSIYGPEGLDAFINAIPGRKAEKELPFQLSVIEIKDDFAGGILVDEKTWEVHAWPLEHSVPTFGYRFVEKPIPGNLDVEKAKALGIDSYEAFKSLKDGTAIRNEAGILVKPDEVVGPPKPGKCFAYITDTKGCDTGRLLARNADLVYHEATFLEKDHVRAGETNHATARGAAEVAKDAGAGKLLIGHFSLRYDNPSLLVEEARQFFQNTEEAQELKRYLL